MIASLKMPMLLEQATEMWNNYAEIESRQKFAKLTTKIDWG